jgi:hypothetical protein
MWKSKKPQVTGCLSSVHSVAIWVVPEFCVQFEWVVHMWVFCFTNFKIEVLWESGLRFVCLFSLLLWQKLSWLEPYMPYRCIDVSSRNNLLYVEFQSTSCEVIVQQFPRFMWWNRISSSWWFRMLASCITNSITEVSWEVVRRPICLFGIMLRQKLNWIAPWKAYRCIDVLSRNNLLYTKCHST